MAFQMAFTDAANNAYAASYWCVGDVRVNLNARSATISYYGWKDAASQAAGFQILQGGLRVYQFTGAQFASFFARFATSTTPFLAAADALALATKDVVINPNDLTQNVSFFAGATQVANPTVT